MHKPLRAVALAACLLSPVLSFAQKEDWLPVSKHDLEVTQVPGSSGSDAIQLYYADFINDQEQNEFFYHRIKILNEKGNRHADVQIEVPPEGSISGLKARTIHPDGKIIEFTGKPFQKTIIKSRGLKVLAKAFTMPDVTVGSIIEYKYKVEWPGIIITDNYWTIQHQLYTVKESFRMKPFSGGIEGLGEDYQVATLYSNMPNNLKPQQKSGGYELDVNDMPAFEAEGYMPPEQDFTPQVRFIYISRQASTADKFWQEAGRNWNDSAERFIGNHAEIRQAAAEAIGNETDPEKKLRKLYARAQQIRNLSYERERNEQEQKKEHLKDNQNAADVLARGAGYHTDITRLFVALARASGFNASVMRVGNRKEKFFQKQLLSQRQLNSEIAVVNLAGNDVYLDPGTRFCPYGHIRWIHTSVEGLKLDKKGGTFIRVPQARYDQAITKRVADMTLMPDGTMEGTIVVKFEGDEALEHRLDAIDSDEAARKKDLEDEVRTWLSPGPDIKLAKVEGWDSVDLPLTATFNVIIPSYASAAGKRLLVPAYLFQAKQFEAFRHADRKFPVYFPYAFGEEDRVNIKLPAGYTLESVPQQQSARLPYAGYDNLVQFDGKQIVTQRNLVLNGIFVPLNLYPEVKDFFGKVQAGDELQAVLKGGTTNAQNSN
jgi:uncharacterized protein DUF3857/transglutaminase superfamily protein